MASIREVAQLSGVSVATVSRVLNGTATVREETRQRVLERVRELDYIPNAAARTLVRRRSQVIGVVVNTGDTHPDLKHPFFGDVLVGLRQALGASHYDLLLFTERQGFLRRAAQHQLDGLVLMGVDRRDPDLRGLLDRQLPAMNVDLDVSGPRAGYVMSDNVGGARTATRHLIELGHLRIATITGLSNTKPAIDRLRGYREELLAHDLPYRTTYVRAGDFYSLSGHEQMRRLLALRRPPTAIFAASDEMAIGAVSAIHEVGLSVPHDVSVVGFDDIESASLLRPPLTTIRQNKTVLGHIAGESLIRLIEDDDAKPPRIAVAVELIERSSASPLRR